MAKLYKIWEDIAGKGTLTVDEATAYKILSATMTSINNNKSDGSVTSDSSQQTPVIRASEDLRYLKQEYDYLMEISKGKITLRSLMKWEEIESIVSDNYCSVQDIESIWMKIAGSKDEINWEDFQLINKEIDEMFDYIDENDDENEDNEEENETDQGDDDNDDANESGQVMEISDFQVWDPNFDPRLLFDKEFVDYLDDFYRKNADSEGLSFKPFNEWKDVREMLDAGSVDTSCLKQLWAEAVAERADESRSKLKKISLDTFYRLNIRLDTTVNEIQEALENLSDEDVEQYYTNEFESITKDSAGVLNFKQLLQFNDIREMLDQNEITLQVHPQS